MNRADPGWKLYLRFGAWTFPGVVLLFFSYLILIPKLDYFWDQVGQEKFDGTIIELLIQSMRFFFQTFNFLFAGFALLVGLVEYFCRNRPSFRIAFYEITSWLFNLGVLLYLGTLAVCLAVLAPLLSIQPP